MREVCALQQQGLAGLCGKCVGSAVAEVELRRMAAALALDPMSRASDGRVLACEMDDVGDEFAG